MSDYKFHIESHHEAPAEGAPRGNPVAGLPRRIFHVERLTRYKSREMRFRVFEETPLGLRPLVNDNGRGGSDGVTYPFQTHHLDRHRRSEYQFAVSGQAAMDVLCRALARHFGEPIGVYRFGMAMLPIRVYDPSDATEAAPAGPAEAQRGDLQRGELPVKVRSRAAATPGRAV